MKESINKVRPKDDTEENTAALELVAESSERLTNSVDRNSERMKRLEQQLADMGMPVHRYSEDKPEVVPSAQQAVPIVINQPKPEQTQKPKFEKKKSDNTGFLSTISNAGKTFAGAVWQAGADFGKSMTDQIGSELLPFYSDMKAAAGKVAGGALSAGKIVKSKFERKSEEKKEKKQSIVPQAVIEKTDRFEKVKEFKDKLRDRKREHFEHKLLKKTEDIKDMLRNMLLMNLIKSLVPNFGSFGSTIGKFAGLFARGGLVFAFFAGLKAWGSKFIIQSMSKIGSAFTSITSGIKETFTKTIDSVKDGWKKLTEPKKVETATPKSKAKINPDIKPDSKPKPMLDKNGKPMVDKAGKPVFEKSVSTVENKVEKTVEKKAIQSTTKHVAIEAAETAGSKFVKKAGARVVAGAAGGPFGEIIAALFMIKDAIELGFSMFGMTPKDVGEAVRENTSMPEVNKAQTAAAGEKLSFSGAAREYNKEEWDALSEAERTQKRKHEENLTNVYKSIATAQGSSNNANTVINNNATYQAPMSFPSDSSGTAMSQAMERAFRNRSF
ncbi:hypothetical protein [Aeromonas salmonicida]|uniref:hypothetical protein n=1 Tax=Aeromonas salmonicida TaxID=645 RepID=UPI003F7BF665